MKKQINQDLSPFTKSGVTKEDLDELMQDQQRKGNPLFLVRYTICNQQISVFHLPTDHPGVLGRLSLVNAAFSKLIESTPLPDLDFVVSMLDSLDGIHSKIPIFAFANDPTYFSNSVLIPDFEALTGNEHLLRAVQQGKELYPWESKFNLVIWRGSMTGYPFQESQIRPVFSPPRMGGIFTKDNFLDFPRTMAVSLSLQFPHFINARYTFLSQCIDCPGIQSQFSQYFDSLMPINHQLLYKYQLLLDGNTAAFSRAYWQLFSNCVIFKQNSDAVQWYSQALQPWIHYIPIQSDLSDLMDVIIWARNHDDLAKNISLNAQNFAKNNLTYFHVMQYLYLLLYEYSTLQK